MDESFGNWKTSDQMTGHEKRGGRGKGWMDRLEEPTEVKESEINGHVTQAGCVGMGRLRPATSSPKLIFNYFEDTFAHKKYIYIF